MKTRIEAVRFIEQVVNHHEGYCSHIGLVAFRQLLDYIYEGAPANEDEWLTKKGVTP